MSTYVPNRVRPGVSTGGQYAPNQHAESDITLAAPAASNEVDDAVVTQLKEVARTRAISELSRWQRSQDKHGTDISPDQAPQVIKDAIARADAFESLPREEQMALAGEKNAWMLEPGQKFGNDRVQLAEGFEPDLRGAVLGLSAQRKIVEAGIPGEITFTELDDKRATFEVRDQGITHEVRLGEKSTWFQVADDSDDMDVSEWRYRTTYLSTGIDGNATELKRKYDDYLKTATGHEMMARSPLKGMTDTLTYLDPHERSVVVTGAGDHIELTLHADADQPRLSTERGDRIPQSMVTGYLDHVAQQNGLKDGKAFYSELQEVFRQTDRHLVR